MKTENTDADMAFFQHTMIRLLWWCLVSAVLLGVVFFSGLYAKLDLGATTVVAGAIGSLPCLYGIIAGLRK